RDKERQDAAAIFGFGVHFTPGQKLAKNVSTPGDILDRQLLYIFASQIPGDVGFDTQHYSDAVDVRVLVKDGVLSVLVRRARVEAANADIFVAWMTGSALVLIALSVLFLRHQVKPIEQFALAARHFSLDRPA